MWRRAAFVFGVWLCVYPLVTGLLFAVRASGWPSPLPLQTLFVTAILVPLMIVGVVPAVNRLMQPQEHR